MSEVSVNWSSRSCLALALLAVSALPSRAQSGVNCGHYANSYAQNASRQGQVLRGGAVGSLVGLGIGSIAGAGGAGAAIGAGIGMIGGGIQRANRADKIYQNAYGDCMSARHR
jgi:hypothetical protein